MPSAHKYSWTSRGKKRTAWRAKWQSPDGPKAQRGFDRMTDALAYATMREVESHTGTTLASAPASKVTVEAWSETWLASQEVRPQTLESYRYAVKRINATLGSRTLGTLKATELKTWRKALRAKYAETTADQTAAILSMMLRAAAQDGVITATPMPPAKGGAGRVVDPDELLTMEQVLAWGEAMPEVCRAMPLVAATTGLRQGELLGLQQARVNWLGRELRVDRVDGQLVSPVAAGSPRFAPPKTPAAARTVPLVEAAVLALSRHLEVQPHVPGEPLFRGRRGQRWRRSTFGDVWRKARDDSGLPGWAHWHSLRDFYASSLIRSGMDLRTVMTLMGHASSEETLRTYARLWPDAQDRARKALEELWVPESEGQGGATAD